MTARGRRAALITQTADTDAAKSAVSCLHLQGAGSGQETPPETLEHMNPTQNVKLRHERQPCGGKVQHIPAETLNSGPQESTVGTPEPTTGNGGSVAAIG